MFSSSSDGNGLPASRPAQAGSNNRSVLSADLRISGDIRSTGAVDVQGEVDGTIEAKDLLIGSEGKVTGIIKAEQIEIRGRFEGNSTSGGLTLRAAAQVAAEVTYETLVIESGAQIEGRFRKPRG